MGRRSRDDPLVLYFTSGTTAKPKMVLHTHRSYPVGHLSTMYWIGLREGDVHWNISSPGWAKHAWSSFFAPWNAGAAIFAFNYERFEAKRVLDALVTHRVTTLCAPPTVWRMLDPGGSSRVAHLAARDRRGRRAAEPRGDRARARCLGHHHPRRLRADGDDGDVRQLAADRR